MARLLHPAPVLHRVARLRHAGVAQLVEQRIRNAKVVGSIPISGTIPIASPYVFPYNLRPLSEACGAGFLPSLYTSLTGLDQAGVAQ